MEQFPLTITPSYALELEEQWNTLITSFKSGKEQRTKGWAFPKRDIAFKYKILSTEEIRDIWKFYRNRQGAFEAFWFIHNYDREWFDEYVDRGDGSAILFDLPCKNTDDTVLIVYINGVGIPATFISGGGGAGADRIQFNATGGISTSSVANPTEIKTTVNHGLTTGSKITISGHTGSTPSINGPQQVTITDVDKFTIPINVTMAGTGGTWLIDPPAAGDTITADIKGELRLKMRFAQDKLKEEMIAHLLYTTGLELMEVRS